MRKTSLQPVKAISHSFSKALQPEQRGAKQMYVVQENRQRTLADPLAVHCIHVLY